MLLTVMSHDVILQTLAANRGYYMIRAQSALHHVEEKDVTSKGTLLTTFIKAVRIMEYCTMKNIL